ncbi:MAG: 2TM domain-containing protein [Maribacter sp.]|uniref:2TM domain-containing protein n=1 Tax=Maribacter sp. TaxID=1897614 RepID=UPI003C7145E8
MEENNTNKITKAKKRVKELKGFYTHLTIYMVINLFLIGAKLVGSHFYGTNFMGTFWHFSTFATPFFWGIGLSFHAIKVFHMNPFFSKDWEQRQIQKYMEEDRKEAEKYKQMGGGYGK